MDPARLDLRSYMEDVVQMLSDELSRLPTLQGVQIDRQMSMDGFELTVKQTPTANGAPIFRMDATGVISLTVEAQKLLTPEDIQQLTRRMQRDLPRINAKLIQQAIKAGMVTWMAR